MNVFKTTLTYTDESGQEHMLSSSFDEDLTRLALSYQLLPEHWDVIKDAYEGLIQSMVWTMERQHV